MSEMCRMKARMRHGIWGQPGSVMERDCGGQLGGWLLSSSVSLGPKVPASCLSHPEGGLLCLTVLTVNRRHGTMGSPSPLCLLKNNGDSWREGSDSIHRMVKG